MEPDDRGRRTARPTSAGRSLRTWGICGLMLLATMLNYMDRQALAQQATEIRGALQLSNEDYGRLEIGLRPGVRRRRHRHGALADRLSLRWLYPAILLGWSAVGFATGWVTSYRELFVCRVLLGFFEAGQWPCALVASQRLLSRQQRPLGNSILQSGASLGAIATPIVVLLLNRGEPSELAAAVPRHRCGGPGLGRRLAGGDPPARPADRSGRPWTRRSRRPSRRDSPRERCRRGPTTSRADR